MMTEIEKLMQGVGASKNFRIVNLSNETVYVEGIKAVIGIETEKITLQLKKSLCEINGSELKIKYIDKTSCVIAGAIASVVTK